MSPPPHATVSPSRDTSTPQPTADPTARRSDPPTRLGHRPALDGVRGLAILGVLLMHAQAFGAVPKIASGAHLGVTVFFVLSGFLITTLLLEEHQQRGTINLRHFYLRRAARLLPALLVLLPFHGVVWTFQVAPSTVALAAIPLLLYVTNLVRAYHLMNMAGTSFGWSLAVEEQFYLGWPPLLKRVLERGRSLATPVIVCLTAVAVAALLRAALADQPGWRGWLYYSTFTRIDALAIGCLAALARWRFPVPWLRGAGWLGLAWLGCGYVIYHADLPRTFVWGLPTASAATAALVLAVVAHPTGWLARLLSLPVLIRFGMLSYGLYLWNLLPFQAWRIFSGTRPDLIGTVICLLIGYAAAELSYRWVEAPVINRVRKRLRRVAEDKTTGGQNAPGGRRRPRRRASDRSRHPQWHAAQLREAEARSRPDVISSLGPSIR